MSQQTDGPAIPEKILPQKILIVRLSALGDIIQTLPVLGILKDSDPTVTVGWLVGKEGHALLENHPLIDHLYVADTKRWFKSIFKPSQWLQTIRDIQQLMQSIRVVNYSVGIDIQGLFKSSFLLWLTHIQRRIGFAQAREGAPWFYTQRVPLSVNFFDYQVPIIQHYQTLLSAVGFKSSAVSYTLPPIAYHFYSPNLPAVYIVLAPGTQWASKAWLTTYWADLITQLLIKTELTLVLVGSPQDAKSVIAAILDAVPTSPQLINLGGQTNLKQLRGVLGQAKIVVGMDSAPLHLAGALGHAKLIGLFGPTASIRTGPPRQTETHILTTEGTLACQPCDQSRCPIKTHDCMVRITPQQVFETILKLLPQAAEI